MSRPPRFHHARGRRFLSPAPGAAATSASAPVGDGIGSGWALVPPAAPRCGAARRHLSNAPSQLGWVGRPPSSLPPSYGGQLSVVYSGERLAVNKDRFVIGRGKQSSDLTIKDPNVSRQHAMVEFLNGQYYMVDMGSTNGVEYNGQRIARKPIAEGDFFRICDHEVRFTYK